MFCLILKLLINYDNSFKHVIIPYNIKFISFLCVNENAQIMLPNKTPSLLEKMMSFFFCLCNICTLSMHASCEIEKKVCTSSYHYIVRLTKDIHSINTLSLLLTTTLLLQWTNVLTVVECCNCIKLFMMLEQLI